MYNYIRAYITIYIYIYTCIYMYIYIYTIHITIGITDIRAESPALAWHRRVQRAQGQRVLMIVIICLIVIL